LLKKVKYELTWKSRRERFSKQMRLVWSDKKMAKSLFLHDFDKEAEKKEGLLCWF